MVAVYQRWGKHVTIVVRATRSLCGSNSTDSAHSADFQTIHSRFCFSFTRTLRALPVLVLGGVKFLEETPGDQDLEQALEENKLVLVKKRHRIKALRNAISELKTQRPHLTPAAVSSTTAAVSGGDAENGDTISMMTASMSLGAPLAPSPAGSAAGGVSGSGSAAITASDATVPERSGQQGEAEGVAREGGGVDFGGDDRGGVMI